MMDEYYICNGIYNDGVYDDHSEFTIPTYGTDDDDIRTHSTNRKEETNRPGVYTVYRKFEGKKVKVTLHETPCKINYPIINAITGIPYFNDGQKLRYVVGSEQEDDVFKIRFVTGERKTPGITLFFDNPEQYERHLCATLSIDEKEKWHEKNQYYKRMRLRRTSRM